MDVSALSSDPRHNIEALILTIESRPLDPYHLLIHHSWEKYVNSSTVSQLQLLMSEVFMQSPSYLWLLGRVLFQSTMNCKSSEAVVCSCKSQVALITCWPSESISTTWLTDLKWASSVVVLVLAVCYSPASLQLMLYNKVVCFLYAVVLFISACTYIGTAADLSAECLLLKPMYTLLKCFSWTCSSTKSHVYIKYCRHIFSDQKPYAILVLQCAQLCTS